MRIKAKTTFIHESVVVHLGDEVDVPEHVGIYLVANDAAVKIEGGKGVKDEITPDAVKVTEQAVKAVETLKTRKKKE